MTKWTIDPMHSTLQFKVKHLVISTVTGSFNKYDGSVESSTDDFSDAAIHLTVEIDSIDTNQEQRDTHLKSPEFFDAAAYPKMEFSSTKFLKGNGTAYTLTGNLTLKGVSKEVTLSVEYGGIQKDGYGNTRAGFDIEGTINRKDFGLSWSGLTESGGLIVSEDVKIVASVQFIKQA